MKWVICLIYSIDDIVKIQNKVAFHLTRKDLKTILVATVKEESLEKKLCRVVCNNTFGKDFPGTFHDIKKYVDYLFSKEVRNEDEDKLPSCAKEALSMFAEFRIEKKKDSLLLGDTQGVLSNLYDLFEKEASKVLATEDLLSNISEQFSKRIINQEIYSYISVLGDANKRYIAEVENSCFLDLLKRLENWDALPDEEGYAWLWAVTISNSVFKNLLSFKYKGVARFSEKSHSEYLKHINEIKEMIEKELSHYTKENSKLAEDCAIAVSEAKSKQKEIADLSSSLSESSGEYNALKAEYSSQQKKIEALNNALSKSSKLRKLELEKKVSELEAALEKSKADTEQNMALAQSYLADLEDLKKKYESLLALQQRNGGGRTEPPTQSNALYSAASSLGLNPLLAEAIISGGFKNGKFARNNCIPLEYVRKNTLGKLEDKSLIARFEEHLATLERQGVILLVDKNKGKAAALNNKFEEIAHPAIREYIINIFSQD